MSPETKSVCCDLDSCCYFRARNLKIKANFYQVQLSVELLHPVSVCFPWSLQQRQTMIYSTCWHGRCRNAELWNCLDSTCRAALCLSSHVVGNTDSCILFPPVRTNPFFFFFSVHFRRKILISGAFNPFLTVCDIKIWIVFKCCAALWNLPDVLVCYVFYSSGFTHTAINTCRNAVLILSIHMCITGRQ